jgi:RNase P protein component
LHKGDIDQESLGHQLISESDRKKIKHQTYNNRSQRSTKAIISLLIFSKVQSPSFVVYFLSQANECELWNLPPPAIVFI